MNRLRDMLADLQKRPTTKEADRSREFSEEYQALKKAVNNLSSDYEEILAEKPNSVHKSSWNKQMRFEKNMEKINGRDVDLIVYEPDDEDKPAKAFYVAFDNETNTAYMRWITDYETDVAQSLGAKKWK